MADPSPRLLHISPASFGAQDEFFGGGERYALELARALARRTPTTLLAFGPRPSVETAGPLKTITVRNWINFRRFRFDPFNPVVAAHIARADIVHVHQGHTINGEFSALAGMIFRRPVFTSDLGGGGFGLHRFANTRRLFAGHLHISEFSRVHSGDQDLPNSSVIYGGVDPARFYPDPSVPPSGEVLIVGRLLPHKGINYLIEAIEGDMRLRVIGRPFAHAQEFRRLLRQLAAGRNVVFDERCSDAGLLRAYQGALCIVSASVYRSVFGETHLLPELLGLTLLEGMACGRPGIATRVTSLPELIEDGVTGFIVPPNDPQAFREKIAWLMAHPIAAARMGEAARQRVLRLFTWDAAAQRCLQAYRQHRPAPPAPP